MRPFLWYLWLAGAVQLVILLANIPLPKILRCRGKSGARFADDSGRFYRALGVYRAGAWNFYCFVFWLRLGFGGQQPTGFKDLRCCA